jgi:hypothetical protein
VPILRRWGALSLLAVAMLAIGAPARAARPYPPPPPPPSDCSQTRATPTGDSQTIFHRHDKMVVVGAAGCTTAHTSVVVYLDAVDNAHRLCSAISTNVGSYSVNCRIPADASFGLHQVIVVTGGHVYTATIEVVPSGILSSAGFGASAGPMLGFWLALALLAVGFVFAPKVRKRRPALAEGVASEIPHIDTTGFVPFVKGPARRRATSARASASTGDASRSTAVRAPEKSAQRVRPKVSQKAQPARATGAKKRRPKD